MITDMEKMEDIDTLNIFDYDKIEYIMDKINKRKIKKNNIIKNILENFFYKNFYTPIEKLPPPIKEFLTLNFIYFKVKPFQPLENKVLLFKLFPDEIKSVILYKNKGIQTPTGKIMSECIDTIKNYHLTDYDLLHIPTAQNFLQSRIHDNNDIDYDDLPQYRKNTIIGFNKKFYNDSLRFRTLTHSPTCSYYGNCKYFNNVIEQYKKDIIIERLLPTYDYVWKFPDIDYKKHFHIEDIKTYKKWNIMEYLERNNIKYNKSMSKKKLYKLLLSF